jgi:hypothetical protein
MAVVQRRCLHCLRRGADGCYVMLEVVATPLDLKNDTHFRRREDDFVAMGFALQAEVTGCYYTWSACLLHPMTRSQRSIQMAAMLSKHRSKMQDQIEPGYSPIF